MSSRPLDRRSLMLGVAALGAGCAETPEPRLSESGDERVFARRSLLELADRYEALMVEHGSFEWRRYAGKLAEGAAAGERISELRSQEREVFGGAKQLLDRFGFGLLSPRQTELWKAGALGLELFGDPRAVRLADELEATINDFQFKDGTTKLSRADLVRLRRSDQRADRRRARSIEHQLHKQAEPVARALLERRRQLAAELGQSSFYSAALRLRGVKLPELEALQQELMRRTQREYQSLVRQMAVAQQAFPAVFDQEYALRKLTGSSDEGFDSERALPFAFAVYRAFGIDLEQPKLDITIREFAFGGQTISVRVPNDVRLVVRPTPGARFYGTLLHELGHAYAATRTRAESALEKGYEWVPGLSEPAFAEGVAEVFGRLLDEPEVLERFLGLSARRAGEIRDARRSEVLASIRRSVYFSSFERLASEQPDANLDALSLSLESRLTGLATPRGTEPVWATSPFLATYPAYTQSYLLASLLSLQVRSALKRRFGAAWISPRSGRYLTSRLVEDGSRWTLREKLINATGQPLNPEALLAFVKGH